MAIAKEHAIMALKSIGLVPTACVAPRHAFYTHQHAYFHKEEDGELFNIEEWFEPFPGLPSDEYNRCLLPLYDHGSSMVEVHHRDGIEWSLARVLFTHSYAPVDMLRETETVVRENFGLALRIVEGLSWHSYPEDGCKLCMYTPLEPMPFKDFCRTLRYWLIVNCTDDPKEAWTFRDAVFPSGTPPMNFGIDEVTSYERDTGDFFAHLMYGGSLDVKEPQASSIRKRNRLGLHARTAHGALAEFHEFSDMYVSYDTFALIWGKYRASLCKASDLMAVLFVAKLRHRAALRAFAPGGRAFARLVKEWAEL